MKRTKENRGITLIALVITIIVMLILVGVTVNVALNGGLFNKTKEAAEKTSRAAEQETLLAAVIGSIDKNARVNFDELDSNLPNGFTGSYGTYESESGNKYMVSLDGEITYIQPEVEKIVKYGEEEYNYWKTNGSGTIVYFDYPEDKALPETLTVPCKIIHEDGTEENITTIGSFAILRSKSRKKS